MRLLGGDNRCCESLLSASQSTQRSHRVNMGAITALVSFLLICSIAVCGAAAAPASEDEAQADATSSGYGSSSVATSNSVTSSTVNDGQREGQYRVSNNQMVSVTNGYTVKITQEQVNNKCIAKFSIVGNGIDKKVEYPCGSAPVGIIQINNMMLIGNEWFIDQPKVLIHVLKEECQKETFTEEGGKIKSKLELMSDNDCGQVRAKIAKLKQDQNKLNEQLAQQQLATQQQLLQMQQNLQQNLQGLFGNGFFRP